jgi:hypothetical protein
MQDSDDRALSSATRRHQLSLASQRGAEGQQRLPAALVTSGHAAEAREMAAKALTLKLGPEAVERLSQL